MSQPDDPNRVLIFDTTLRDGEQSPGISLNTQEKLEIAQQLARLGVDVIEAGFPITSPGDFEAVQQIARTVEGPVIAGLMTSQTIAIDGVQGVVTGDSTGLGSAVIWEKNGVVYAVGGLLSQNEVLDIARSLR